jgi:hypothetical protein
VRGIPARVAEMSVMIRWVRYQSNSNAMSLLCFVEMMAKMKKISRKIQASVWLFR